MGQCACYLSVDVCPPIYIYIWHTPDFDTKSKKQNTHTQNAGQIQVKRTKPWSMGGVPYIYIYICITSSSHEPQYTSFAGRKSGRGPSGKCGRASLPQFTWVCHFLGFPFFSVFLKGKSKGTRQFPSPHPPKTKNTRTEVRAAPWQFKPIEALKGMRQQHFESASLRVHLDIWWWVNQMHQPGTLANGTKD